VTQLGGLGAHAQYDDDGNPLNPDAEVVFGKVNNATTYYILLHVTSLIRLHADNICA
jgi:hypothetical protein